jgi:Tol biopolymer transport system component
VRVAPSGDRLVFLEHPPDGDDRGVVVMVDLAGKRTVLTPVFPSTQGTAWSPGGDEVWFTASRAGNSNDLLAVSQKGVVRPLSSVPGSLHLADVSRSGRVLLSASTMKGRLMVLPPGQTTERDLSWQDYPILRDISGDGRTILFEEQGQAGGRDYSVFIRGTDGAPAVRLGDGYGVELSPDGRWALSAPVSGPRRAVLLPIGPGEPRVIDADSPFGTWFPDSRRLLFCGAAAGKSHGCSVYDLESGHWRTVTPDGFGFGDQVLRRKISPDGRWALLLRTADSRWVLWPLEGGDPRPLEGMAPGDFPVSWTGDGKRVYLSSDRPEDAKPCKIYILDPFTGRKQFLKSFGPSDLTGIGGLSAPVFSRDGRAYAYRYSQIMSDLYVADGIR